MKVKNENCTARKKCLGQYEKEKRKLYCPKEVIRAVWNEKKKTVLPERSDQGSMEVKNENCTAPKK